MNVREHTQNLLDDHDKLELLLVRGWESPELRAEIRAVVAEFHKQVDALEAFVESIPEQEATE